MSVMTLATVLLLQSVPGAEPAAAPPGTKAPATRTSDEPGTGKAAGSGWQRYDYQRPSGPKDEIPSGIWVIVAYLVLWGILLAYVVVLAMRQSRLRSELAALAHRLDRTEVGPGRASAAPGQPS
jgi:hypothetical protein